MASSTNNLLLVGGGGREHALAWKLAQSPRVHKIFVLPGNAGIASLGENVECVGKNKHFFDSKTNFSIFTNRKLLLCYFIDLKLEKDYSTLIVFCRENKINLVAVGPEEHLEKGIVDVLEKNGIMCFGPTIEAAKLETSKAFAKDFLRKNGIPTARYVTFTDSQKAIDHIRSSSYKALVVKASGLAAGKGVTVAKNIGEACQAVRESLDDKKFKEAGAEVVVEELLEGVEVSALAFSDGEIIKLMPFSQDHKQLLDNDKGPNTGGMGAYAPVLISREHSKIIEKEVLEKAVRCMKEAGTPYKGVLYAGIMITKDGPQVLEFNCRFGDPETQVLMRLLKSDLYEIMVNCCQQKLSSCKLEWFDDRVVCGVVLASGGYPDAYEKGFPISGLDEVTKFEKSAFAFHCGTKFQHESEPKGDIPKVVSWGGRVLCVTAAGSDLIRAYRNAYYACARIYFEKCQYRHDIGAKSLRQEIFRVLKIWNFLLTFRPSPTSYSKCGVSVDKGNELVDKIKNLCSSTNRSGCDSQIGSFGAVLDLKSAGYVDPILVSGTDGVGTKLKIAQEMQHHSHIGCDLVAMCVNDILVHRAESLLFLDYYATGRLNVDQAAQVVQGIAHGCHIAGCALAGGETAEMPDFYEKGDYDLAGFALGCVNRKDSGFPDAT
uniref:Phosphoribosylamine--glycine ligase n=1 Tax=Romanomermis culicivorax TaxID=13658 RepID=A0A915I5R5_ROMCU